MKLEVITDQCCAFDLKLAVGTEVGFFSLDKYYTSASAGVSAPGGRISF